MSEKTIQPTGYTLPVAGRGRVGDDAFVQDIALTNIAGAPIDPATEAKLEAVRVLLASVSGFVDGIEGLLSGTLAVAGTVAVSGIVPVSIAAELEVKNDSGNPLNIAASALPLPAGAASETTLSAINTKTLAAGQALSSASSPVVLASDQSPVSVVDGQSASSSSALTTVNAAVSLTLNGRDAVVFAVSGTYSATLAFEGSADGGTNWVGVNAVRSDTLVAETSSGALVSTVRVWMVNVIGFTNVRLRVSAFTSGSVSARGQASAFPIAPAVVAAISGTPAVTISGTPAVAQSGTWTVQPGNTANTTPWLVAPATPSALNINSAATTNATSVKASAGRLFQIVCSNVNAAARFLKLYNKASAPVPGTDIPVLSIPIPASGLVTVPFGELGHAFTLGIALAITGAAADLDSTAIAAGDVKALIAFL